MIRYRLILRDALARTGFRTNPGETDEVIRDAAYERIVGQSRPKVASDLPSEIVALIARKYGWSKETALAKIDRTKDILALYFIEDAALFLKEQMIVRQVRVICDGCSVNTPFEHRCHGSRAVVQGEQTGRPCQCLDCFTVNEIGEI